MKNVVLAAVLLLAAACADQGVSDGDGPAAPSASSAASDVLTISDTEVEAGQIVEVSFEPPPDHDVWGVDGELWQERKGEWKRIAWTSGWAGKPKMGTAWPTDEVSAFPDVGFRGSASWRWKVPARLEPGNYELRKESERARFTVVAG